MSLAGALALGFVSSTVHTQRVGYSELGTVQVQEQRPRTGVATDVDSASGSGVGGAPAEPALAGGSKTQSPEHETAGSEHLVPAENTQDAVTDGLISVIHERFVDGAEAVVLSGSEF